jgi:hypothetical protein
VLTALIIAALIVAGAATAVGGVLVWASGRKALTAGEEPRALPAAPTERGLDDLRPGDVVQHDGKDFLVEGVLSYDEDGKDWSGARLVDGDDERWLMVGMEPTGPAALRLCRIDRELEVAGYPPDALTLGGDRYRLDRRGTATVRADGDVGGAIPAGAPGTSQRCRWWRYEAAGERGLVIEQWGQAFRVLRGATLEAGDLDLMPGS